MILRKGFKFSVSLLLVFLFLLTNSNLIFALSTSYTGTRLGSFKNQIDPLQKAEEKAKKSLKLTGIPGKDYLPGQLIVKFKNQNTNSLKSLQAYSSSVGKADKTKVLKLAKSEDLKKTFEALAKDPNVEFVEPNYIIKPTSIPNDPSFNKQWALTKMHVPEAWDVAKGSSNLVVAVIDSGVDLNHEDLASILVPGKDFIDVGTTPEDEDGHGTHVAGIIAAVANNNRGIAGIANGVKIMPLRVLDDQGGTTNNLAQAIYYAADHGAKVINLSLGGPDDSYLVKEAINYAHGKGVVITAAAGNSGGPVDYPAADEHVIGVGATDLYDEITTYSNHGSEIDVAAPGDDIYSTVPNTKVGTMALNYDYLSGTSMASPQVAALAALIFSQNPSLTPDQVEQRIKVSSDDLGNMGFDEYYGYGRVNAYKALTYNFTNTIDPTEPNDSFQDSPVVKPNQEIKAKLSYAGDIDIYKLSMTKSGLANITLNLPRNIDGLLTIYNSNHDVMKYSDLGSVGETEKISLHLNVGTYYLEVMAIDDNYSTIEDYSVLANVIPDISIITPVYSSNLSKTKDFQISWVPNETSFVGLYDIEYKVNASSNTWIRWKTAYEGKSALFNLGTPGNTYYFRIRASKDGNLGYWSNVKKTIIPYDNNNLIVSHSGFSNTYLSSSANYYLGTIRYSLKANENISFKFTGNQVAISAYKGPGRSKAKIYVDGVYRATIDSYSSTGSYRQVIYGTSFSAIGTHTIKVVNLGTAGRNRLDIDGIAVGK